MDENKFGEFITQLAPTNLVRWHSATLLKVLKNEHTNSVLVVHGASDHSMSFRESKAWKFIRQHNGVVTWHITNP